MGKPWCRFCTTTSWRPYHSQVSPTNSFVFQWLFFSVWTHQPYGYSKTDSDALWMWQCRVRNEEDESSTKLSATSYRGWACGCCWRLSGTLWESIPHSWSPCSQLAMGFRSSSFRPVFKYVHCEPPSARHRKSKHDPLHLKLLCTLKTNSQTNTMLKRILNSRLCNLLRIQIISWLWFISVIT